VLHMHKEPLALVTPMGWGNCGEVCLPGEASDTPFPTTNTGIGSHVCFDAFEFVKRSFLDVYAVSGHSDSLLSPQVQTSKPW